MPSSPSLQGDVEARFEHLVGLIYDCALAPSRLPELLGDLAALFGAHFADSFAREHDGSRPSGVVHGLDHDDYRDGMIATWSSRNPWTARAPVVSAGEVRATWQFLDRDELRASEMFADYLDRRDLHEGMRFEIWADAAGIEDISLIRSFSAGPFTTAEMARARALMPHLQRAGALRRRLQRAELVAQASVDALAALDSSIMLVDHAACPVFLNPAAEALLAEADAITLRQGQFVAATTQATRHLARLLHRATLRDGRPRAGAMLLPSGTGRRLSVLAMPVRWDGGWSQPGLPAAIVCMSGNRSTPTMHDLSALTSIFGLTTAETRLALMLLSGRSVTDIARAQGRSLATVRTHLARLMAKTETTRQSDLLRRLVETPRLPTAQSLE